MPPRLDTQCLDPSTVALVWALWDTLCLVQGAANLEAQALVDSVSVLAAEVLGRVLVAEGATLPLCVGPVQALDAWACETQARALEVATRLLQEGAP